MGALADAIALLLGDVALRRTIAERARRRTEQQFDMIKNGARLAQLLCRPAAGLPLPEPARAAPALSAHPG